MLLLGLLSCCISFILAEELTFELPDNERMCFYEEIDKGQKTTVEFQVVEGGNYDCDLEIKSPSGKSLYKDIKKQFDSFTWTTDAKGEYEICFSNEFSTFTHKVVYFDFQVGEEKPLRPGMEQVSAMTLMETSAVTIHESLKEIEDYQTHHRLRESHGRAFAEELNMRVLLRSAVELVLVILTALVQVFTLRRFFSDKRNRGTS
ncbi:transmembrane emp24 domain-containing protein 7-like [Watersipora subatra]|uniref:transmembrane emp24 domain-containing protein 7-like n=1 Tax=Watersipora subatra TaxID=2589382 RepID=UPI00355C43FA